MFFFYFQARADPDNAPLVIWMTGPCALSGHWILHGIAARQSWMPKCRPCLRSAPYAGGPGCSSELAVFFENGPYNLLQNETLEESRFGWDVSANMIFVDQPLNTGFSYSSSDEDRCYDEKCVSNDMLDFLLALFEARPELAGKDIYVTGESYAGHYVPAVASRLFHAHSARESAQPIQLKGLAIGNGLTNPRIQVRTCTHDLFASLARWTVPNRVFHELCMKYGAYADYLRVNNKIGPTLYYYVTLVC